MKFKNTCKTHVYVIINLKKSKSNSFKYNFTIIYIITD